ncbi:MAG: lipase, partial [Photobacterium aquimaris]|nr:lipase [Photobacterium aquimaris]
AIVAAGADKDSLIYTMALTTQSTTDALATAKALMASKVPQMLEDALVNGIPAIGVEDIGMSVANILAPYPEGHELFDENIIPQELVPLYSSANFMQGSITLPYYLGVPKFDEDGELIADTADAPLNGWWKSLCDSGAILAGVAGKIAAGELPAETIPTDAVSVDDGTCQALGLRSLGFDTKRHLTKYSPVPKANADMAITVQMTTPDVAVANDVREDLKLPTNLVEPENGWPVVILQHGITSKKEDMLAITGILSIYGFATVAIDHPLHGSRGFDTDMDGIDDINASTVSATDYMNLASLLTTRDNLRQSTSDLLGLRLGMNFLGGEHAEGDAINIDTSKVHFLGHSLGAITGINFIGLTNTALDPEVDPLFAVNTNSLAMPGVMVANFLLESGAFGGLVKSSLAYAASPDFQGFVALAHQGAEDPTADPTEAEMVGYYQSFYALLTPEQQAGLDGTFAAFAFAAQTVTDAGDPANYAAMMAATSTPTHLIEVIGNGSDNLSDQVIP